MTDGSIKQEPEKPPRKKRAASKMIVGVEMTMGDIRKLMAGPEYQMAMDDTTVLVIRGRVPTVKTGEKLAEKDGLTGQVVIACERSRFKASVVPQWLKGVAP